MNLIVFVLACYGLTSILVWGKVFDRIRPKHAFFHCSQCVGFWVGVLIFSLFWISNIKLFPNSYCGWLIFGCISSGTSYILDMLVGDCGFRVEKTELERNKR
jgi:cell division protein FtsW (lipid II flippase)